MPLHDSSAEKTPSKDFQTAKPRALRDLYVNRMLLYIIHYKHQLQRAFGSQEQYEDVGGHNVGARLVCMLTCEGGINPYPGAYTGRGWAMGLPRGPARAPPGFVICLSNANPLKVPFTMSVTIDTARLRLCGVPLMVTFVGSTVWSICRDPPGPAEMHKRCHHGFLRQIRIPIKACAQELASTATSQKVYLPE